MTKKIVYGNFLYRGSSCDNFYKEETAMGQALPQPSTEDHPQDGVATNLLKALLRFELRNPHSNYYFRTDTPEELEGLRLPLYKKYALSGRKPETVEEWAYFYERFIAGIEHDLAQYQVVPSFVHAHYSDAYAK